MEVGADSKEKNWFQILIFSSKFVIISEHFRNLMLKNHWIVDRILASLKNRSMLVGLVSLLVIATQASGESHVVSLSVTSGKAPLEVQITGPAELVKRFAEPYNRWTGCGYNINWGEKDNLPVSNDCKDRLKHTFKSPGSYKIRVYTIRPGSNDAPTSRLIGETIVTVR